MDWLIEFFSGYGYLGMFLAAFLSGTVFPFSSELLLGLFISIGLNAMWLLIMSTVGNILGGLTCYWVGRLSSLRKIEKWFRVSPRQIKKAEIIIQKTGYWAAFLGFVPFLGETILIVLGMSRVDFWKTCLMMSLGKLFRYIVVILSVTGAIQLFQ